MRGLASGSRGLIAVVGLVVTLVLGNGASRATAAETHAFDPVLSLTGNCSTSAIDPIPDPGCPGGVHPPFGHFTSPASVTADSYGDIYVVNYGGASAEGTEGRIDVFDPKGNFITELADDEGPRNAVVDDEGIR
jgi:hypothetical protein